MEHNFFPQRPAVTPTIYAYRLPGVESHKGYLKIGYTNRTAQERIEEQLHTSKIKYEIVLVKSAMANDGSCFTDKDIHRILESKGCHRLNPLDKTDEWFKCSVSDVEAAILSLRTGSDNVENRRLFHIANGKIYSGHKHKRDWNIRGNIMRMLYKRRTNCYKERRVNTAAPENLFTDQVAERYHQYTPESSKHSP